MPGRIEENNKKPQSGQLVSVLRFELRISLARSGTAENLQKSSIDVSKAISNLFLSYFQHC
jgi:hypothetical protein